MCSVALQPKTRPDWVQHNGLYVCLRMRRHGLVHCSPGGSIIRDSILIDLLLGNEGATEWSLNPHPGTICWGMNLNVWIQVNPSKKEEPKNVLKTSQQKRFWLLLKCGRNADLLLDHNTFSPNHDLQIRPLVYTKPMTEHHRVPGFLKPQSNVPTQPDKHHMFSSVSVIDLRKECQTTQGVAKAFSVFLHLSRWKKSCWYKRRTHAALHFCIQNRSLSTTDQQQLLKNMHTC